MSSAFTETTVTIKTESLLARAHDASEAERQFIENQVVELNIDLARALASRYAGRGADREDLIQVACVGLVKAARRYDPEKGHFGSFAVPTILGELKRYFRDHGWMVRPPRRIQDLQASVSAVMQRSLRETEERPDVEHLAAETGAPVEDVREALGARGCFAPASLDAQRTPDGRTFGESFGVEEENFETVEGLASISAHCRKLPERDRQLLALRFFGDKTQQEIAYELGITQMQVSRRLKRVLEGLREAMAPEHATAA